MLERDYEGKTYTILFKFYFYKKLGGILNQSLSHFLKIVIQQFVVLTTAKYDLTVRNDCSWHDMRVNGRSTSRAVDWENGRLPNVEKPTTLSWL